MGGSAGITAGHKLQRASPLLTCHLLQWGILPASPLGHRLQRASPLLEKEMQRSCCPQGFGILVLWKLLWTLKNFILSLACPLHLGQQEQTRGFIAISLAVLHPAALLPCRRDVGLQLRFSAFFNETFGDVFSAFLLVRFVFNICWRGVSLFLHFV